MYIKTNFTFKDLKEKCWQGAIDTLATIEESGKESELMDYLDQVFKEEMPNMIDVNYFLWFDKNLLNDLGLNEQQEEPDEEEM